MADKTGYIGRNPGDSAVTVARQFFTASGVTTAFTFASGYLTGYLDIYVDGVKKRVADEFTATDGSTFDVLQGGVGAGSTVEAVAYKAFNATTVSGDITGNFDVSGNTTLGGSLDIVGGTTLTNLVVTGISTLGTGTTVGFANTAFNLGGTPNISVDLLSAVDINVSGAATIGGVLTYEDVTNIDSVGIVTARSGVNITANGLVVNAGVSTLAADLSIADKIVHTGDTNTAIRFPSPDTVTVETTGVERVRVNSDGVVDVNKGLRIVGGGLTVTGISTFKSTIEANVNIQIPDSPDVNSGRLNLGNSSDLRIYHDGTDSHIDSATNLTIRPLNFTINGFATAEDQAKFIANGPVELYYDGVKKFETTGGGVIVTGVATATSFVGAVTGAVTGNADTATTSTNVTVADESSDTTCFPLFATAATGNLPPKSGTNLTFNSSTGALTATSFVGALTGNVTGNISGGTVAGSTGTFSGDVDIADKIIHTGDTNTAIRFPAADTFTVETAGGEAIRIDSSQRLIVGTSVSPTAGSGVIAKSVIQGNTSNSAGAGYLSLQRGQAAASISTNETLGQINFSDSSGYDYAIIKGQSDAAGGTNDYPGKLIFGTTADGASTTTDRLTITSAGLVRVPDNGKFTAGAGDDLEIYHDGSDSHIDNNTGDLNITTTGSGDDIYLTAVDDIFLRVAGGENAIVCSDNGNVALYHNNVEVFQTTGSGIVLKATEGAAATLEIQADEGDDNADRFRFEVGNSGPFKIENYTSGSWETNLECNGNGNVELYHDNTKRFETTASGVTANGTVSDTSGDLRITPISAKSGDYTLVATDTGKTITRTGGNITVPQSMTAGMIVTIINNASSTVSIIQGTNVTLRFTDSTTGTKTLAAYGVATVTYISASSAYITGTGLS